jgi:CO dehydrogenase/acetyl-CoA synthase beta subunit
MAAFDECIKKTAGYVAKMRDAGRQVRELSCIDHSRPLPFRVGTGAASCIVLKSDTFLELGSPTAGSCAFVLYSNRTSLVRNGRVRLIGPDVQESQSSTLSFGQVIIAGGETLTDGDYQSLIQSQYIGDKIEGYMVKSMPGHIWGRISNEVGQKGFGFEFLGRALMKLVKTQIPKVTAAEVLFVTSDKADVRLLCDIELHVRKIAGHIKNRMWKQRGIDISDCAFGGDCGSCKDKSVCDKIRQARHDREKAELRRARRA